MTEDVQANPLVFSSLKLRVKTETLADTGGPYRKLPLALKRQHKYKKKTSEISTRLKLMALNVDNSTLQKKSLWMCR